MRFSTMTVDFICKPWKHIGRKEIRENESESLFKIFTPELLNY